LWRWRNFSKTTSKLLFSRESEMRCYFHLVNCHETLLDDVGIEVSDLEMAKLEARKAIAELRQEDDGSTENWSGWRLDIVCTDGSLLHSLNLNITLH
jgi:hypothetical protein